MYSLIYKLSQHKLNSFVRFNDIVSSIFNVQKVHIYYLKKKKIKKYLKLILQHWAIQWKELFAFFFFFPNIAHIYSKFVIWNKAQVRKK